MNGKANEQCEVDEGRGPGLYERRVIFGTKLREAREQAGLGLLALAQSTRINPTYLEALERGDFTALPGEVFARGFVKNACKACGIDGAPYLQELDACFEKDTKKSVLKIEIKNKPGRYRAGSGEMIKQAWDKLERHHGKLRWGAVSLAVFLVVGAAVRFAPWQEAAGHLAKLWAPVADHLPSGQPQEQEQAQKSAAAEEGALIDNPAPVGDEAPGLASPQRGEPAVKDVVEEHAKAESEAVVGGATQVEQAKQADVVSLTKEAGAVDGPQTLEFHVSAPVRVRMELDRGGSRVAELVPQTYRYTFKDRADLLIYDASALEIRFNGRSLGELGGKGRIRRLSFQAQDPEAGAL